MAKNEELEVARLRDKLLKDIVNSENRIHEILIKQNAVITQYVEKYAELIKNVPKLREAFEKDARYIELNTKLTKGYADQVNLIAQRYGIVLDKAQKLAMTEREVLKHAQEKAKILGDDKTAENAKKVLDTLRAADTVKGVGGALLGITSKGGLGVGEVSAGLGGFIKSIPDRAAGMITKLGTGFAGLVSAAGMITIGLAAAAFKANLDQLKDRIKSASQGMATLADLSAVKEEASTYYADVKAAAATHMIESEAVQAVANIMKTTAPGSIKKFLESTDAATMSLATVVQHARLLGISEQQAAQVLSDTYKMSARSLTGEARKAKATEELNLLATYAYRSLRDNIMTTTDFTSQLRGALQATSAYQTSAGSLGALMDSLSRIQSKSAPALGNVGQAAAELTTQMRGFSESFRAILGGGFGGIWSWTEMEPTEMIKAIKDSFLSPFVGLGPEASSEAKALSLMVLRQVGLSEQQARWMVEMGALQEATQAEIAATRTQAKEAQDTYKEIQGGITQLIKQGDRMYGLVSNIGAKLSNIPVVK